MKDGWHTICGSIRLQMEQKLELLDERKRHYTGRIQSRDQARYNHINIRPETAFFYRR